MKKVDKHVRDSIQMEVTIEFLKVPRSGLKLQKINDNKGKIRKINFIEGFQNSNQLK